MKITLKSARVNAGFTQSEASEQLGITVLTLRKWEKSVTYPDIRGLKKIEELYDVKYEDLIF